MLAPFFRSLKHSAINEDLKPAFAREIASVDEMFGAGHGAGGAKKLDVRQTILPFETNKLSRQRRGRSSAVFSAVSHIPVAYSERSEKSAACPKKADSVDAPLSRND